MADVQRLYCLRKDDASQVVLLRDRTSIHRGDRVYSCELNERLMLRVLDDQSSKTTPSVSQRGYPGVTYVPGLICHPCSRPHARVRRPFTGNCLPPQPIDSMRLANRSH